MHKDVEMFTMQNTFYRVDLNITYKLCKTCYYSSLVFISNSAFLREFRSLQRKYPTFLELVPTSFAL